MNLLEKSVFSTLKSIVTQNLYHNLQQHRSIVKVRLKWVKNRGLDHIIDVQTDLKAACLLKDAILRSPVGYLTAKSLDDSQKLLGLTVPTLRFIRRYPTLFEEFPHPKYSSLPCFKLTHIAKILHDQELKVFEDNQTDLVERLSKVLMMTTNRMVVLQSLHPLKWDLGLPDDFDKKLIKKFPDDFRIVKGTNGLPCLKLVQWPEKYGVSELQKMNDDSSSSTPAVGYREFKRGKAALEFPMSFPRGYGAQKKVKAWMDEFQKLPYISPYEDSRGIDPDSDLMEKRVVGVLHEFLSLTLYKKTKRNYLRNLREELYLPHRFTRIFTRYPGIFYLSLKCKTTTVALREGYRRGRLVNPHPLTRHRDKFHHVMRTGLIYRSKGVDILPQLDNVLDEELTDEEIELADVEEIDERDGTSDAETGISLIWFSSKLQEKTFYVTLGTLLSGLGCKDTFPEQEVELLTISDTPSGKNYKISTPCTLCNLMGLARRAAFVSAVTIKDDFFFGHFLERPIMPGVLMIGQVLNFQEFLLGSRENFLFAGIDRFGKPVASGDTLATRMTLIKLQQRFGIAKMRGMAYIAGDVVCEGEFSMATDRSMRISYICEQGSFCPSMHCYDNPYSDCMSFWSNNPEGRCCLPG
ncbi:hypothetical protein RND71_041464 [Anisodus tanguticus]|uniref:PORR domain-containing protein n=1 Tax=Anisodus tanguticus TaxID=243964 RepID=A0AAE1QXF4_9SOLA|nr:hypothetical protein RND71_041464 [Anisodus tanguticus]